MNLTSLHILQYAEFAVAAICFLTWISLIKKKGGAQYTPTGGTTMVFLIMIVSGLAGFADTFPLQAILVAGTISLILAGLGLGLDEIAALNRNWHGVWATTGVVVWAAGFLLAVLQRAPLDAQSKLVFVILLASGFLLFVPFGLKQLYGGANGSITDPIPPPPAVPKV